MLHLKNFLCITFFSNALVAESVDAADLKSVGIYPVPVQVWPSAPKQPPFREVFLCSKGQLGLQQCQFTQDIRQALTAGLISCNSV